MPLAPGTPAPDFTLPSTEGRDFTLSRDAAGTPCVLFFYPQDASPVCTAEACLFRDHFAPLQEAGLLLLGISRDTLEQHRRFQERYRLPFLLLSDPDAAVIDRYEARYPLLPLPRRVTYLLDRHHRILDVYDNPFNAEGHVKMVLRNLERLA
ncbi:MAG: peroxiredoxin [Bacteroidetes bacterium]|nr:MAG: peroxiredoxin [Bacteroidota bacterium]GIV58296.1 MAG: peroxiredoxin [Rhodothermaceae bacterium]